MAKAKPTTHPTDALADAIADALAKCPHKAAAGPLAASPVFAAGSFRQALRDFFAKLSAAGIPIWTILLKALPILLADLAAGKPLAQIIADVIAAFTAGTL